MRRILVMCALAAGCGTVNSPSDGGGNPTPTPSPTPYVLWSLTSGEYAFDGESVMSDTCWQQPSVHSLLIGFDLPFTLTTNGSTSFTVVGTGITADVIPPLEGAKDENDLSGAGSVTNSFSADCSIRYDGSLTGVMTTNDGFAASVTLDLVVAGVMNEQGTAPSNCSAFAGMDFPGTFIPVPPAISANTECSITIDGRVYRAAP